MRSHSTPRDRLNSTSRQVIESMSGASDQWTQDKPDRRPFKDDISSAQILAALQQGALQATPTPTPQQSVSLANKKKNDGESSVAPPWCITKRPSSSLTEGAGETNEPSSPSSGEIDEQPQRSAHTTTSTPPSTATATAATAVLTKNQRKRRNHKANQKTKQATLQQERQVEEETRTLLLQEMDRWLKAEQEECLKMQHWMMYGGGLSQEAQKQGVSRTQAWLLQIQERRLQLERWHAGAPIKKINESPVMKGDEEIKTGRQTSM
ncbi:hypothetical protein BCR37DRAFT_141171 [Protomyces lactucae-debilis]|uniref:Uncharacterized protein n=1 Tax=Protomyces lactucae-debilis TaxID=2754530 RepID=A0A1Y2FTY7_PROLT|nr:uncharacterized protein BCR37DRAFT_141171 [Protomyces lactucae-debilis]ORY87027.1 hypothetical protein BCR37DRAFT_141171 [Protomyces lactucae-debilis]